MLLFELFPAFMAVVAVVVGVLLYAMDRRARDQGIDDSTPVGSRPTASTSGDERSNSNRPSMRG